MEEFEDRTESLNIINSVARLESDIKCLETKFRYAMMTNQNGVDRHRNDNRAEAKNQHDEEDEQSEAKQEEQSEPKQEEEFKHDIFVPRYHIRLGIDQFSNESKMLLSRKRMLSSNARIVSQIYANEFNRESNYFQKQQLNGRYQDQDYINDSQLELNLQQEQV